MDEARWLDVAWSEIGEAEIAGPEHNPRIVEYHAATTLKATEDEVPWCASFACWVLGRAGLTHTASARARDFLAWGHRLRRPREGCIVVLSRGPLPQPGPGVLAAPGHVGFFVGFAERSRVLLISGNVANRVGIDAFGVDRILGLRWPPG